MAKNALTDTCFWLGLLDPADQYHENSRTIANLIANGNYNLLLPWPCLYESISTHLVRKRDRVVQFEEILKSPQITLIDDNYLKETALNEVFAANKTGYTYSLTDAIIREILKDINLRIDFLITYNSKDFFDVCAERQIQIID